MKQILILLISLSFLGCKKKLSKPRVYEPIGLEGTWTILSYKIKQCKKNTNSCTFLPKTKKGCTYKLIGGIEIISQSRLSIEIKQRNICKGKITKIILIKKTKGSYDLKKTKRGESFNLYIPDKGLPLMSLTFDMQHIKNSLILIRVEKEENFIKTLRATFKRQ